MFFGLTAAAPIVFRRYDPAGGAGDVDAFRVPGHPVTTTAFVAVSWLVVANTVYPFPGRSRGRPAAARRRGARLLVVAPPPTERLVNDTHVTTRQAHFSPYIEWAKLGSSARFNLAASGVHPVRLAELGATPDDVEIEGTSGYGYEPLLERVARKCDVPEACVVLAAGTSMANHLAMAALLEPGDEAVIERPTYEPLLSTAVYLGARVRRVDRRADLGFALDPDATARAITRDTKLVILANLHNPASAWTEPDALRRIGEAACRVGARVLVDEVYLDAVFDRTPASAFHLGPVFVATNSLTKVYGLSGLRCGWILCDAALARRTWRLKDLFDNVPAVPAERLSVVALDRLARFRERARTLLDANRTALREFLGARHDLDVVVPTYGTTVFPRPARCDAERLCAVLRERYDTSVVPGRYFEVPDRFRIGLCGPSDTFVEGLARLGDALDELSDPRG